ncbi:MAG: sulfite oxidase [Bacteroidia bacterium]|nr:sulfite oxidase [Bacteroidia bacterium]
MEENEFIPESRGHLEENFTYNILPESGSGAEKRGYWSRRGFLKKGTLAVLGTLVGTKIAFANRIPKDLDLLGLGEDPYVIPGKSAELVVLNDRPLNAETPVHLLDPEVTPGDLFFVRNNGIPPVNPSKRNWQLVIEGESAVTKKVLTLDDLKTKFREYSYQLTLECGGNGRKEFFPPAKGNQWTYGAVGCATWTGVRLKDVLNYAGVKADAVYVGYEGADTHLNGDSGKKPISRGIPIAKAMEDETLIAWKMNGEEIPLMNGYPLRLVVGGWPASTSGKWLNKLLIRNKIHDGAKMEAPSYMVPCKPVGPGAEVANEDMCIIESMPVKSIITFPKTGGILKSKRTLEVRGHAWAGDLAVQEVQVSIDYGATWQKASLKAPANRLAWQRWTATLNFPDTGYYEVWAKATDTKGVSQPMVIPNWNPKGYLNNACHRIAIKVQ